MKPIKQRPNSKDIYLNKLNYSNNELRLFYSQAGIEWVVIDFIKCFCKTPNLKILTKLRSLPASLKFVRLVDGEDGNKCCFITIAHEIIYDFLLSVLSTDELLDFYGWFMAYTKYHQFLNVRGSSYEVISYFNNSLASDPKLVEVAA